MTHANGAEIAVLFLAPVLGIALWLALVWNRLKGPMYIVAVGLVVLAEIYVLIGAVLAGVPIVIAGPIWVILVFFINILGFQRRRRVRF